MRTRRGSARPSVAVVLLATGCRRRPCQGRRHRCGSARRCTGSQASVYAQGLTNAAAMAFDPDGRLWVATAAFDDAGTDAVYVVEQSGSTPVAVIADAHTPLGLLWVGDTLYVAATGGVTAYSGFDGTTFVEHHTVVALPADVGEVNGLALSSDGRISLGVSAPCDSCTPTSEDSAAVLSFLPDGSDLRVDASGIRAPIGLAYFPDTDRLFVTMNQRDDLGDATPGDWLSSRGGRSGLGLPRVLRARRRCMRRRARTARRARPPRSRERHRHRDRAARRCDRYRGDRRGVGQGRRAHRAVDTRWLRGGGSAAHAPHRHPEPRRWSRSAPTARCYTADWATGTVYRVTANSQTTLTAP